MQEAILSGAYLKEANLDEANLVNAVLNGAILQGANFTDAHMQYAYLASANLRDAILTSANLTDANLFRANLEDAFLYEANLRGAILGKANLSNAMLQNSNLTDAHDLTEQQLVLAAGLRNAVLPNGSLYDGRYKLVGDLSMAKTGHDKTEDALYMSRWYGVSLDVYQQGQMWADKNLPSILEQATREEPYGLFIGSNMSQPLDELVRGLRHDISQPAVAPAQPAPRRNGHYKASTVAHRTRR